MTAKGNGEKVVRPHRQHNYADRRLRGRERVKGHRFALLCKLKIPRPAVINQSHWLCAGFAKGICMPGRRRRKPKDWLFPVARRAFE